MAKAKSGGTRSYLKGKVGSDVYSVGKDGKGKKQQVVRGLAETVANPRTQGQELQRMLMTSVSELGKALRFIIDHSFDGISTGQPSISEFSRRALAAYRKDAKLTTPTFGYLPSGSKLLPAAAVDVAAGKAKIKCRVFNDCGDTYNMTYGGLAAYIDFQGFSYAQGATAEEMAASAPTWGDVVNLLFGGNTDNYLTIAFLASPRSESTQAAPVAATHVEYARIKVKESVDLTAHVAADPVLDDFFEVESTLPVGVQFLVGSYIAAGVNSAMSIGLGGYYSTPRKDYCFGSAMAVILSKKTKNGWEHSDAKLITQCLDDASMVSTSPYTPAYQTIAPLPADFATALATYPLGTERFLNGGDL